MADPKLVLIGAGTLPEQRMRLASEALAEHWPAPLRHHACGEDPDLVLSAPSGTEFSLLRLAGDAGLDLEHRRSWLEALGDWRMPTLLMAATGEDGAMPGCVPAYAALCTALRVPLVGLVQIGGPWLPDRRRRDGLPWCGEVVRSDPDQNAVLVRRLRQRLQRLVP